MSVVVKRPVGRPSVIQKIAVHTLQGIAEDFIKWMEVNRRVASGNSKNFVIEIKRKGAGQDSPTPNIEGKLKGAPYLNFALFGRGQGKAPTTDVILQWMRIRGIRGRDLNGRFRTDRQAAYAIAKQIGRVGTRALKMSPVLQDSIIGRNTRESIALYTPELAQDEAERIVERFKDNLKDVTNMKIS